jgi:hypothetical protein
MNSGSCSAFLSQKALENYRNGHISYDVPIIAPTDDLKYPADDSTVSQSPILERC